MKPPRRIDASIGWSPSNWKFGQIADGLLAALLIQFEWNEPAVEKHLVIKADEVDDRVKNQKKRIGIAHPCYGQGYEI